MHTNFVIIGLWLLSISVQRFTVENHTHNSTQYRLLVFRSQQNSTFKNSYSFKGNLSVRLVNNSISRNTGLQRSFSTLPEDNESMENLLMQVLIFILCAAGVSAVTILCCIICLHSIQLCSRSTVIMSDDGRVHMMPNGVRIGVQRTENNETVLTLLPVHRHPEISNAVNEHFHFQFGKQDLPPSYDELSLTKEEEEAVSSPPPPPYTPSFRIV